MADLRQDTGLAVYPSSPVIDGHTPRQVLAPDTPEALAAALQEAVAERLAVAPVGGGTRLSLGYPPERLDLALSTARLDQVLEHSPADLTISVQAGVTLGALQAVLALYGQQVALDAPYPERATIGGILASASSGPRRLGYGHPRDQVIGMRVAQSDGKLTKTGGKVVKNVTGYDLAKLYCGSLGTLGVIVEVNFRLLPLPKATGTIRAAAPTLETALALRNRIVASPLRPLALEVLGPAAIGGNDGWTLAVEFGGGEAVVARQLRDATALAAELGLEAESLPAAEATTLWDAVRDFSFASDSTGLTLSLAVLPGHLGALYAAIEVGTKEVGVTARIIMHAGHGVMLLHLPQDALAHANAPQWGLLVSRLREATVSFSGSLVVESCPAALKTDIDVWGPPPASFPIMHRLKQQFDPSRTLNPGRFVGHL